jgi:hypothetical protein
MNITITATFHETDRRKGLARFGRHTRSWEVGGELFQVCAHWWDIFFKPGTILKAVSVTQNNIEHIHLERD